MQLNDTDIPARLALLIAAPQPGETAMLADQAAIATTLLGRGHGRNQDLRRGSPATKGMNRL